MSEGRLTNVYCWKPEPGVDWMVHETSSGITCIGQTREEALTGFRNIFGERAPFQLIEHPPPRPKRPDDRKPTSAAIDRSQGRDEGDTAVTAPLVAECFHKWSKRWHPDVGGGSISCEEGMRALIEMREAATKR